MYFSSFRREKAAVHLEITVASPTVSVPGLKQNPLFVDLGNPNPDLSRFGFAWKSSNPGGPQARALPLAYVVVRVVVLAPTRVPPAPLS